MSSPTDQPASMSRSSAILLSGVIGVAIVGYFVGINDGVPRESEQNMGGIDLTDPAATSSIEVTPMTIPATSYSQMRRRESGPTSQWTVTLDQIPQPPYDPLAEIKPSDDDKRESTLIRATRRAFNGAPPIIPHVVEKTADAACYACHGKGMQIGDRVANPMSHGFLANCMQCHSPPPPKPFADTPNDVENAFVGLPAPLAGERAFPGAPPTIPHSTWMRQQCLSCHGNQAGWAGLQATHPWRINCTQCHAPSASLEQAIVPAQIGFVPGPTVGE